MFAVLFQQLAEAVLRQNDTRAAVSVYYSTFLEDFVASTNSSSIPGSTQSVSLSYKELVLHVAAVAKLLASLRRKKVGDVNEEGIRKEQKRKSPAGADHHHVALQEEQLDTGSENRLGIDRLGVDREKDITKQLIVAIAVPEKQDAKHLLFLPVLLLAVLVSGNVLVVVNTDDPEPRVKSILEDCRPDIFLTTCKKQKRRWECTSKQDGATRTSTAEVLHKMQCLLFDVECGEIVFSARNDDVSVRRDHAGTSDIMDRENYSALDQQSSLLDFGQEQEDTSQEWFDEGDVNLEISHIFYTSGSTGTPKGCVCTVANLMHYCNAKNLAHKIDRTATVLVGSPFAFDPCLGDVVATLFFTGRSEEGSAQLVFRGGGVSFFDVIKAAGVTHLLTTPTLFTHEVCRPALERDAVAEQSDEENCRNDATTDFFALDTGRSSSPKRRPAQILQETQKDFASLQLVALGGEKMPETIVRFVLQYAVNCNLANTYGVTECCVYQTFHYVVERAAAPVVLPGGEMKIHSGRFRGAGELNKWRAAPAAKRRHKDKLGTPLTPAMELWSVLKSHEVEAEEEHEQRARLLGMENQNAMLEYELVLCGSELVGLGYLNRPELTVQKFFFAPAPEISQVRQLSTSEEQSTVKNSDSGADLPPQRDTTRTRCFRTGDLVAPIIADECDRSPEDNETKTPLGSATEDAGRGSWILRGRKDNQLKINGLRIEPEEIEAVVLANAAEILEEVAVVPVRSSLTAKDGATSGPLLVACCTVKVPGLSELQSGPRSWEHYPTQRNRAATRESALLKKILRELVCAGTLSAAHTPHRFFFTNEKLPRTGTGKIHRAALSSYGTRFLRHEETETWRLQNGHQHQDGPPSGHDLDQQDDETDDIMSDCSFSSSADEQEGQEAENRKAEKSISAPSSRQEDLHSIIWKIWCEELSAARAVDHRSNRYASLRKSRADFRELGGDSLSAVRVCAKLAAALRTVCLVGVDEKNAPDTPFSNEDASTTKMSGKDSDPFGENLAQTCFAPAELLRRTQLGKYARYLSSFASRRSRSATARSPEQGQTTVATESPTEQMQRRHDRNLHFGREIRPWLFAAVKAGSVPALQQLAWMASTSSPAGREAAASNDIDAAGTVNPFTVIEPFLSEVLGVALLHRDFTESLTQAQEVDTSSCSLSVEAREGQRRSPVAPIVSVVRWLLREFTINKGKTQTDKECNGKSNKNKQKTRISNSSCPAPEPVLATADAKRLLVRCLQTYPADVCRVKFLFEEILTAGAATTMCPGGADFAFAGPARTKAQKATKRKDAGVAAPAHVQCTATKNQAGRDNILFSITDRIEILREDRQTLLHIAARAGCSAKVLEYLFQERTDQTALALDVYGRTPLHWAVTNGHRSVVEWLLTSFPPHVVPKMKDLKDEKDETAVQIAERRALCANRVAAATSAAGNEQKHEGTTKDERDAPASLFGGLAKLLGGSGSTKNLTQQNKQEKGNANKRSK
ncbi:unnamed protein product [Amoebophrya sp. A120]|nr:unnamed protein product [Amoebophrya sp. A120]|eukprot:GSA120T00010492001.1